MYFIQFIFKVLLVLFFIMAFTIVYTAVANYIGEQFGFGKFFMDLWKKINKKYF